MARRFLAKWTRVSLAADLFPRSSQGLAVVGDEAFLVGGEVIPRTPVDLEVVAVSLADGSHKVLKQGAAGESLWPSPRVGAPMTASDGKLYVWGGRGGKDMGTFSASEAQAVWSYDPSAGKWSRIETTGSIEQRSYHVLLAVEGKLYVHAGCPQKGRLPDLDVLDLATKTWTSLASAPEPGRGGTVLASLDGGALLGRFGGFAGYELGGPFESFSPATGEWTSHGELRAENASSGPAARSVHGFVGVKGPQWTEDGKTKQIVGLLTHGEATPAPAALGHDGAGSFHDDSWALVRTASSSSEPDFSWLLLEAEGEKPAARGWFATASYADNKLVIHGGIDATNARFSDLWILEVAEAQD